MMTTRFSHEVRTPTFALTTLGVLSLAATRFGLPYSQWVAFLAFMAAAGGVAMALGSEVNAKQEKWEWDGIYRSLRKPTPTFWVQVGSHLPQLFAALCLAFFWYKESPHAQRRLRQNQVLKAHRRASAKPFRFPKGS